jgi:hypothetical protein
MFAVLLFSGAARADFFSSSPGPLTKAHAHIDGKDHCQDCHVGSRDLTNDKCLACHKPIGERIQARKGLHASSKAFGKPCQDCHTDHKGLGKDILGFHVFGGRDKFDHNALTPFVLDGKHQTTKCDDCHKQKTQTGFKTYLKASEQCVGCHDNPHGDLREPMRRCERCHDARNWRMLDKANFDHDRDTRYPLEKKHQGVTCVACHAKKKGNEPPNSKAPAPPVVIGPGGGYQKLTFRWATWGFDCTPCHDNVHGTSLFGQKACKVCHSAKTEWAKTFFDHNRRTKFPLDGAHADPKKATCYSCHKKDEKKAPSKVCETCHPDVHKDRFDKTSTDCGACHTANNWPTDLKFDHNKMTKFPLSGAHANADCRACHRGKGPSDYENVSNLIEKRGKGTFVQCMGCHRHENVHKKQYTNDKCLDCHKMAGIVETKPRAINEFHGPNSRFPLTEGHKGVECIKCHPGNVFTETPLQCGPKCHADDLHKGTLGNDCLSCHSGGKWEARLFDHDTKTNWPLVGNHKDVLCEGCHPKRNFANNRNKGVFCINCHRKDDVHGGALGDRCENCHSPDGKLSFDHNDPKKSDWPLLGKHGKVRCAECHTNIKFKPTPRECGPCHPEPDIHRGQLGTLCGSCHIEKDWKIIKTGHDVPTPRFGGAHDGLACVKCHPQGKLLAGMAKLCISCHRQDDVHHNSLGPNCGECHTQRTFNAARFEHSRVGCDLVGIHRTIPCVNCHKGGNYTALSTSCVSCHQRERALADVVQKVQPHSGFVACALCHNPNYWGPLATGVHASGRESVCR